jgi:hypothetical protein
LTEKEGKKEREKEICINSSGAREIRLKLYVPINAAETATEAVQCSDIQLCC